MIKILFLLLFAGVWSWNQPVSLPIVPQTIVPNFQAPALTLPKGTSIAPLCDPSLNVPCLQQWVHQARSLAVTAPGASLPIMKYFLPSLLIRNSLPTNTKMDGWELFTPSFSGSRRSSSRRRTKYYRKESDSSKIRRVIEEEGEVKEIKAADAINVDADTVEAIDAKALKKKVGSGLLPPSIRDTKGSGRTTERGVLEQGKDTEGSGRTTERGVLEQEKDIDIGGKKEIVDSGQVKGIVESERSHSAGEVADKPVHTPTVLATPIASTPPVSAVGTRGGTSSKPSKSTTTYRGVREEVTPPQPPIRSESAAAEEGLPEVVITKTTAAVQGKVDTPTNELSGCVEVESDSIDDLEAKAVCEDCYQDNPQLRGVLEKTGTLQQVVNFFRSVARGGMEDRSGYSERISGKLAGTKICSPDPDDGALKLIISNFNNNKGCKPMKFNDFFKKTYCKSCNEQSIPPEIILSMITIESAGKCDARGDTDGSMGLLQVNSRDHKCGKGYTAGTKKNKECLMDPDTNVKFGMNLLKKGYNAVNPKKSWKKPCSRWSQLGFKERDKWRRAVAAYNGNGGGWINRAVQSIEGNVDDTGAAIGRNPYESTMKDLNMTHVGSSLAGRARKSKASWEELRIYFLMEKLLPGNTTAKKTGRADKNILSNLAHTEAVLGRENEEGRILPGIVDYWEEYVKKHKPKTCSK